MSLHQVESMAPDQAALVAARKLRGAALWPQMARSPEAIWGECQGSGSAPYRLCVALPDLAYRCSCPSRKLPCKHVLALLWEAAEALSSIVSAAPPDWVLEWLLKRKPSSSPRAPAAEDVSIAAASGEAGAPTVQDPAASAAQRERLRMQREQRILAGLDELDRWIADRLDAGLAAFSATAAEQCRFIARRLFDAQAPGLAGQLEALPDALFAASPGDRDDLLMDRLGRLHLQAAAYRRQDELPPALRADVRRAVGWTTTREAILADPEGLRVRDSWRAVATRAEVQRDGLRRTETWLARSSGEPRFALLLDFAPVSAGATAPPFQPGEVFAAELAFYPSAAPLRALVAHREQGTGEVGFSGVPLAEGLDRFDGVIADIPWLEFWPLAVRGEVRRGGDGYLLADPGGEAAVPLAGRGDDRVLPLGGLGPLDAVGLWDGRAFLLFAADTPLGPWRAE